MHGFENGFRSNPVTRSYHLPGMHRQYFHASSRTISYFDSAPGNRDARIILLIHAFPLGAAMWEPQAKALPAGWRRCNARRAPASF